MRIRKKMSNNQLEQFAALAPKPAALAVFVLFVLTLSLNMGALAQTYYPEIDGTYMGEYAYMPLAGKDANDYSENINKKFDKINEGMEDLIDNAIDSELFGDEHKNALKRERGRMKKVKDRFHGAGGFKKIGRKHNLKKKDKDKEDEYEEMPFQDFEDGLDDFNNIITGANKKLKNANEATLEYLVMMEEGDGEDKCQALVNMTESVNIAAVAVRSAALYVDWLFNTTDGVGNFDVAGFNCSIISAAVANIKGPLEIAAFGLEYAAEFNRTKLQSECLEQVDDNIEDMNSVVANISGDVNGVADDLKAALEDIGKLDEQVKLLKGQVEDLTKLVNDRFDLLDLLLNNRFGKVEAILSTPAGRREDFPNK